MCGHEDAAVAAEAGAAYLGVILAPGFRRSVTADDARVIFRSFPARRVGVFVDADEDCCCVSAAEAAGVDVLQLHGDEPPELAARMRAAGWEVWKAVRARDADDFAAAVRRYAGAVDALLLDGYEPARRTAAVGVRFDWKPSPRGWASLPDGMRLIAAGGLRPDNVADGRPHPASPRSGRKLRRGVRAGASRTRRRCAISCAPSATFPRIRHRRQDSPDVDAGIAGAAVASRVRPLRRVSGAASSPRR